MTGVAVVGDFRFQFGNFVTQNEFLFGKDLFDGRHDFVRHGVKLRYQVDKRHGSIMRKRKSECHLRVLSHPTGVRNRFPPKKHCSQMSVRQSPDSQPVNQWIPSTRIPRAFQLRVNVRVSTSMMYSSPKIFSESAINKAADSRADNQ